MRRGIWEEKHICLQKGVCLALFLYASEGLPEGLGGEALFHADWDGLALPWLPAANTGRNLSFCGIGRRNAAACKSLPRHFGVFGLLSALFCDSSRKVSE
jgi:hypothetical protein